MNKGSQTFGAQPKDEEIIAVQDFPLSTKTRGTVVGCSNSVHPSCAENPRAVTSLYLSANWSRARMLSKMNV